VDSIASNTVKADQDALLNASMHIITNLIQNIMSEENKGPELKQIMKLQQCINCFSNNYQLDKKYFSKNERNKSDKILTDLTTVPVSSAIAKLVTQSSINPQLPHITDDSLRLSTISNTSRYESVGSYMNTSFPSIDNTNEDEIITHAEGNFGVAVFQLGNKKEDDDDEEEQDDEEEEEEDDIYYHDNINNDLKHSNSNITLITTPINDNDEVIDHINDDLKQASIKELSDNEVCNSTENQLEDENFSSSSSKSENILVKKRTCETVVNNPEIIETTIYLNNDVEQTITLPPLKKATTVIHNVNDNSSDDEDEVTNYYDPLSSSVSHI
jgi:hypothetical protein